MTTTTTTTMMMMMMMMMMKAKINNEKTIWSGAKWDPKPALWFGRMATKESLPMIMREKTQFTVILSTFIILQSLANYYDCFSFESNWVKFWPRLIVVHLNKMYYCIDLIMIVKVVLVAIFMISKFAITICKMQVIQSSSGSNVSLAILI